MQRENKMGVKPVPQLLVTMALPLMLSLLVQSLYNIVDSIFVARISESALTATTLAYPIQLLMVALSVGTSVGMNALLSRLLGARKTDQVSQAAVTGLVLAVASSLLFTTFGLFFAKRVMLAMAPDAETGAMSGTYLSICTTFCIGIFVETMSMRFLQSSGKTVLSMISQFVGAGTNIILDPILIFGLFGAPALGIRGAAIATVTGQWMGAITALTLNTFLNPEVKLHLRGFRFEPGVAAQIYRVGLPTIIMQAMGSVMNFSMNAILLSYSATAVAFFGVYFKLQSFLFMPINGLGQATIPIVGYNYGAGKGERIGLVLKTALKIGVSVALIATIVFELFPAQLLSLFKASEDMLAMGVPAIRIIAATFVLSAVTSICGYSGSGLGNGVINMTGTLIRQVVLLIPFAFLFLKIGGIGKVWYAMWISELTAVTVCTLAIRREMARKVRPLLEKQ